MVPLSRALIPRILLAATLLLPMALPSAAVAAVAPDAYEAAGDDEPATARDLTYSLDYQGSFGWFAEPMSQENHTFDWVDDTTATSDEDWVKFRVTSQDLDGAVSYIVEAVSQDFSVDPVIEMYGPVATAGEVVPTTPGLLPARTDDPMLTDFDPNADLANDEGHYFSMFSSSLSFIPEEAEGWYYIRVRPYYQIPNETYGEGFKQGEGRYTLRVKTGQLTRVSGATRVDTAVAISRERFGSVGPVSNAVVIANSYGFADALAGSTLAGVLDCPVLLTPRDTLAPSVASEIQRLRLPGSNPASQTVYLLGGSSALYPAVEAQVAALGATTVRVQGQTRTETARRITEQASQIASDTPSTPFSSVAFLASSRNFPDALAASPMATYNHAPVLMTPGDALDPHAAAALQDEALGITDVVIVGGTGVISPYVHAQVAGILGGTDHVHRISGASRYQTARNFAVWATGVETGTDRVGTTANQTALAILDFQQIGIASGRNFPDALAGGVFCGLAGSPLLLTSSTVTSPYLLSDEWTTTTGNFLVPVGQDYWFANTAAIMRSYVFGGTGAVSADVMTLLDLWSGPAFPAF